MLGVTLSRPELSPQQKLMALGNAIHENLQAMGALIIPKEDDQDEINIAFIRNLGRLQANMKDYAVEMSSLFIATPLSEFRFAQQIAGLPLLWYAMIGAFPITIKALTNDPIASPFALAERGDKLGRDQIDWVADPLKAGSLLQLIVKNVLISKQANNILYFKMYYDLLEHLIQSKVLQPDHAQYLSDDELQ